MTAKPTICAQHPASAAPPASPVVPVLHILQRKRSAMSAPCPQVRPRVCPLSADEVRSPTLSACRANSLHFRPEPLSARLFQSGQQCCCRRYQQVDFRLLAHRFSHLAGENHNEVHRERTSCVSHCVCGITHRRQRKQHHIAGALSA